MAPIPFFVDATKQLDSAVCSKTVASRMPDWPKEGKIFKNTVAGQQQAQLPRLALRYEQREKRESGTRCLWKQSHQDYMKSSPVKNTIECQQVY